MVRAKTRIRSAGAKARGFTYVAMLFAVATADAVAATGSVVWAQEAQLERERELLRIGEEFRRAIGLYYERSPGSVRPYMAQRKAAPRGLDVRQQGTRHLQCDRSGPLSNTPPRDVPRAELRQ